MAYNPSFLNIDPATGKPKMLPTTMGTGTGSFNLQSLIGAPAGSTTTIPGMTPMPTPGMPVDGSGGAPNPTPAVSPTGQLPGYILDQTAGSLASDLRGEVPKDVQDLLAQQAAEYGVGSGTQGSQFQGYRGLKNLGLTSMDIRKHAQDILAGQFTKPAETLALNQAQQRINDMENQFNKSFGLEKEKLAAQLKLEKDKFAEATNQFNKQYQLQELQNLGIKYGGGGSSSGGRMPNMGFGPTPIWNPSTGTTSYY